MSRRLNGSEGEYELHERLGAGGNGEVWRATGTQGSVAVKLLKKSTRADAAPRFVREIEALRRLKDVQGVLPLLDADPAPASSPQPWYVMPVATLLRNHLGRDAGLQDICIAIAAIAAALARVHDFGIVHRDIKPDNLYWYDGQWCLGDFGLADFKDADSLTPSNDKLGPAYYIAPEMLNSAFSADGKSADIYSLGKTIWVLASGQRFPLPGVHDPTYAGAALGSYRIDDRCSSLDELVRRMTLLDPAQRPSAETISQELEFAARKRATGARPDTTEAFARLRAVVLPYSKRESDKARQIDLAKVATQTIKTAIDEIAESIQEKTQLKRSPWSIMHKNWGTRVHMRAPTIEWQTTHGHAFRAGGKQVQWRLCIGVISQLLSNNSLYVHAGYAFDEVVCDQVVASTAKPRAWNAHREAMNGTPSCDKLIRDIISSLQEELPTAIDEFTRLVSPA